MSIQPIILLTFSNRQDSYLPFIMAEHKAIKNALLDYEDNNYLQVRDIQHTSTDEIFYLINRYHNRIPIFHFGGHANGQSLQLEKEVGVVQVAQVNGLAGLLGTQKNLKLVFLNGCATKGQVKILLDAGVPAVIATSVKVNDEQAQIFSTSFYQTLGSGSTLQEAFIKAKAFLELNKDSSPIKEITETRDIVFELEDGNIVDNIPWGLYWKTGSEEVLDWSLPQSSPYEIHFSSPQFTSNEQQPPNSLLVTPVLFKVIRKSEHVEALWNKLEKEKKTTKIERDPTDAELKDAIIRSYPAPISVHLRALFSLALSKNFDKERLEKLVATYKKTIAFLSFSMLSNMWDFAANYGKPLIMEESEKLQLLAFFNLNTATVDSFDYFLFADALLKIAHTNKINFYLNELNIYDQGWLKNKTFKEANDHYRSMQTALEEDIPSQFIQSFCLTSETHLANLLKELHFLIHYKMAVIKYIEVEQIRNLPPIQYNHRMVELDNNYSDIGEKDQKKKLENPIDKESVLLYKTLISKNLNLSPFILDQNALIKEPNSKIFFFSHTSEKGLQFKWIEKNQIKSEENKEDTLSVNNDQFSYIKKQFEKARQQILNEQKSVGEEIRKEGSKISWF